MENGPPVMPLAPEYACSLIARVFFPVPATPWPGAGCDGRVPRALAGVASKIFTPFRYTA